MAPCAGGRVQELRDDRAERKPRESKLLEIVEKQTHMLSAAHKDVVMQSIPNTFKRAAIGFNALVMHVMQFLTFHSLQRYP